VGHFDAEAVAGQRSSGAQQRQLALVAAHIGQDASASRASATKAPTASKRDGNDDGGTAKASAGATPVRGARPPRGSAANSRAGSSRTSRRQQDVLRPVKQCPGITVSEIAKELGVDATGLYWPVHKLERGGAIIKRGVALQPASG
jgi:hypothetical protein